MKDVLLIIALVLLFLFLFGNLSFGDLGKAFGNFIVFANDLISQFRNAFVGFGK